MNLLLSNAAAYATTLHMNQTRKQSNVPYVSHLYAVAALVLEHGGTEEMAAAALLHDALEDQAHGWAPGELAGDIKRRHGEKVLALVQELTETESNPKPPWQERKKVYLAHMSELSDEALLIALADKTHNALSTLRDYRRLEDGVWDRFNAGKEWQRWWYVNLRDAFYNESTRLHARFGSNALLLEFDDIIRELFPEDWADARIPD